LETHAQEVAIVMISWM